MAQPAVGFKVEGLNQVVRALTKIGVDVDDLKDAFSAIAAKGAQIASAHAPVKSGALAGDVRGNRAKSKAVVTAGRARIRYAGAINYGWPRRNITGAGFMQAADREMQPIALQMLEDEINRSIREQGLT